MMFPKPTPREKVRKLLRQKAPKREQPTLHGRPVAMGELRHYVIFDRDRGCVASELRWHECRDRFGRPHDPHDLRKLELAHVPARGENALGKRAPDDELHGVAECHAANANVSAALREFERRWIELHEPAAAR